MHLRTPIVIITSFVVALILMLLPLPSWLIYLRPQLLVLTIFFWVLNLPQRVGIATAWCLGLVLDAVYNVTFGVNAFTLVLIAYVVLRWRWRIGLFSFWQKALFVFSITLLYLVPQFFIWHSIDFLLYCLSSVISALVWPYFELAFEFLMRRFRLA